MLPLALLSLIAIQSTPTQGVDRLIDPHHVPAPAEYKVNGVDKHAIWIVRGKKLSIDFTARRLIANAGEGPRTGIGILLDHCEDVSIKNLDVEGFQQNIVLRDCKNVKLLKCKASNSRAIRMTLAGKPTDIRLNLTDLAAWRTYGAGIWLERCLRCAVQQCSATDSQNGIVAIDTDRSLIYDNECSFNGGWGIALWHCANDTLAWNHADFCNRKMAEGWGGNSAGIAVVNGSELNEFVANSLSHDGDGLILSGKSSEKFDKKKMAYPGACRFNFIAYCDGSLASNNAFFDRYSQINLYFKNQATESNTGMAITNSDFTLLLQNDVKKNRTDGVAIFQGQGNSLFRNVIEDNLSTGVHIWSGADEATSDHPAKHNTVITNRIANSPNAVNLEGSIDSQILSNTIEQAPLPPGFKQGATSFSQVQLYSGWQNRKEAKSIDDWMFNHKPVNWKFFREASPDKGLDSLKPGEYGPIRS